MKPLSSSFKHCAAVSLTLALACSTALAGKPEWAGNGNGNGNGKGHHKSKPSKPSKPKAAAPRLKFASGLTLKTANAKKYKAITASKVPLANAHRD